jgi:class 3 adenylate cyclase
VAGSPARDTADLYGAAVNLAARVCATAKGGQILVSSVVKELAIGKALQFTPLSPVVLKGFDEPVQLFELIP